MKIKNLPIPGNKSRLKCESFVFLPRLLLFNLIIKANKTYLLKHRVVLLRDLYKFSGKSIGGAYKNADNVIAEEDNEGNRFVRFQPVPAWETPDAIKALCDAFDDAIARNNGENRKVIEQVNANAVAA